MPKYSPIEIKQRRMLRLAQLIHDHWTEGSGMDTRYFEVPLIHDSFVEYGYSASGGGYREHAVPRVFLRDACSKMYDEGATIEEVADALTANLWIVYVSLDEARHMDHGLGHKTTMPKGWKLGVDDPFARFHSAGISIIRKDLSATAPAVRDQ